MKFTVIELVLLVALFAIVGATFQVVIIFAMVAVLLAVPAIILWFLYHTVKESINARSR